MFSTKNRTRILILGVIILVIIGGFFCVDFSLLTQKTSRDLTRDIAKNNIEKKCTNIEYIIDGHFSDLEALASIVSGYGEFSDGRVLEELKIFGEHHQNCRIGIADIQGRMFEKDQADKSIEDEAYFRDALNGGRIVSDVMESGRTGRCGIVFAVPVYRDGKVAGVLRSLYQRGQLNRLLHVTGMDPQEEAYIVQKDGAVALSVDENLCGKNLRDVFFTLIPKEQMDEVFRKMDGMMQGSFEYILDEERHYCNYAPIPGGNWYLFSVTSAGELGAYTKESTFNGIIFVSKMVVLLLLVAGGIFVYMLLSNRQIRNLADMLENVTNHAPGGMLRYNPKTMQLTFINEGFYQMLRCTKEEFEENYHNDYSSLIYKPDRDMVLKRVHSYVPSMNNYKIRYRLNVLHGEAYWVQQVSNVYQDKGGTELYGILVDIAEYKAFEDELSFSNQRYRIIVNQMESCFVEYDIRQMRVLEIENFLEIFGRNLNVVNEKNEGKKYVHEDDWEQMKLKFNRVTDAKSSYEECESRIKNGDGVYLWCLVRFYSLLNEDGTVSRLICKINNIDKRKRHAIEMESKARKDPLTGLYNKSVAKELIEAHLETIPENIQVIFVLDVDNFKNVNDTYGHSIGDGVLNIMAATMQNLFRKSDITGRVGGDEFIVYMKDCFDEKYALKKAEQLCKEFYRAAKNANINATCSIGLAIYPNQGQSFKELFEKADLALYKAKRGGRNRVEIYREEEE